MTTASLRVLSKLPSELSRPSTWFCFAESTCPMSPFGHFTDRVRYKPGVLGSAKPRRFDSSSSGRPTFVGGARDGAPVDNGGHDMLLNGEIIP